MRRAVPLLVSALLAGAAGLPPTAQPPQSGTPASPAAPTPAPPAAPSHEAVFPRTISPKYAHETPGKQRLHTCLDQYHANKERGANGGMKWIQSGGGYYSACLKSLKGT